MLPCEQLRGPDLVVAIPVAGVAGIHAYRRGHQAFERYLVHARASLCEVDRRVDVCAAVLRRAKAVRSVPPSLWVHALDAPLELEALLAGPVDGVGIERMREIDQAAVRKRHALRPAGGERAGRAQQGDSPASHARGPASSFETISQPPTYIPSMVPSVVRMKTSSTRSKRFRHHRRGWMKSSASRSNSATTGGCTQACTSASTWPAPITGESVVMGAVKKAAAIVMGCAKAAAAPSVQGMPVTSDPEGQVLRGGLHPRVTPTATSAAAMPAGIPQPSQRVRRDTGGMRSSAARSTGLRSRSAGEHAGDVAGADHDQRAPARRLADALREIAVAFVDQDALEGGQDVGELGHHAREHILLAQLAQILLGKLGLLEQAREEGREEQGFLPQRERRPGAAQRHPHVAVAQRHRNAEGFGRASRLEQLAARLYAERPAELLLIGSEHQVRDAAGELPIADQLLDVERVPALGIRQRLVALAIELEADGSGRSRSITSRTRSTDSREMCAVPTTTNPRPFTSRE